MFCRIRIAIPITNQESLIGLPDKGDLTSSCYVDSISCSDGCACWNRYADEGCRYGV